MAAFGTSKVRPLALLLIVGCALGQLRTEGPHERVQLDGLLVQSAVNSLNESSPTGRTYKGGELVGAQILTKPPNVIYRLTLNMEPVCKANQDSCPHEICMVDVQQHEWGVINVPTDTIHCTNQQPQTRQENTQEQEIIENIEKQIINQSISLDHEVQTSADHNDRPFIAVRASQSEYCPGCPYELNPRLPGLSSFGDQVLQSMDEAGVSDFKHKLISIVRVTRAVPPGSNNVQYQLLMEIGESTCLRSSHIILSECPLQSNVPIKLCLVTIEKPWKGNLRITKNNCTELLNTDNEVSASVDPNSMFYELNAPYKDDDVSTKTEFYDQIAQEAQEVFRVPYIDLSTQEVVDGTVETDTVQELPHTKIILEKTKDNPQIPKFSDKMKEFDEFLEDFDIPIKTETTSPVNTAIPVTEELIKAERVEDKITEEKTIEPDNITSEQSVNVSDEVQQSEDPELNPTVETVRSKRSSVKPLENNKPMLRKVAREAIVLVDALDEDNKKKHLIDVLDSKRERQDQNIVYSITVEVAATDCDEQEKSNECLDEVIPGPTEICKLNIAINEKKPLESIKLLHYNCNTKQKSTMRFKRYSKVGAPEAHSPDDPEVQKFVQLGLKKYTETHLQGTPEPILSSNVKDVTVQVVAGLKYKIRTDIGVSTCIQGTKENCELKSEETVEECLMEVWSRPWEDGGNPEVSVQCNRNNNRRKRSLKGQNYSQKMLEQSRQYKQEKLFQEFMREYKKIYDNDDEKDKRFEIFKSNLDIIQELQRNEQGTAVYGVTQFTDLTKAEFKAKYLGLKPTLRSDNDIPMPRAEIPNIEIPPEFDWRHYNAVTPVKNQGSCGSCWAFSVTGNIEGQYAIKHGKLLSFSEQELVDCDEHDSGCNGGLPDNAYRAIEELGGLESESDYPYEGENEKCHFSKSKVKAHVVSGLNITSNETKMAQWLVANGPMSIGINANAMQFYIRGISHPFHFLCSPDSLDHGVLIVGYGISVYPVFKLPYWIIKNSWGPRWGEHGYYRVYRGDGSCGVNQMVTSAVVA